MGFTSDLLAGVAQKLEDAGVGVYHPSGVYLSTDVGIVFDVVPANPEQVVVLTAYSDDDDPTQDESAVGVQVRTRGTQDPRTSQDMQDAAFDVLHNLPRQQIGGTTVSSCLRRSTAYLGVDGNGRHERVSNYRITLHRPSPHRS